MGLLLRREEVEADTLIEAAIIVVTLAVIANAIGVTVLTIEPFVLGLLIAASVAFEPSLIWPLDFPQLVSIPLTLAHSSTFGILFGPLKGFPP